MRARTLVPVLLLAATLVPAATRVLAQSPSRSDLLVGTWVLDIDASRYRPGPAPRAETRVYTRAPDGIKGVIKRTYADGHVETIEYMAETDREYMVTGTPAYDSVILRQITPYEWEAHLMHGGNTFGVARRVISRDGKTMRITFRRPDEDVLNVAVYDKK